jgi:MFS family permease
LSGEEKGTVPWMSIFTSIYFWALVIPHMCENYLSGTTVSWFPTYMKTYLKFNIKEAAFLASLPFLMKFFVQLGSAFLADLIMAKGWWGRTIIVRKVFTSIAFLSSCVAYVFVAVYSLYWSIPVPLAIFCLVVGESFLSFNYPGYRTCLVDFAPKYCGILYGISNTLASVSMAVGPILAGQILMSGQVDNINATITSSATTIAPYNETLFNFTTTIASSAAEPLDFKETASQEAWSTLFIVCSAIVLLGLCVFLFLGTNEEQEWAKPKPKKEKANGLHENGDEKEKEDLITSSTKV